MLFNAALYLRTMIKLETFLMLIGVSIIQKYTFDLLFENLKTMTNSMKKHFILFLSITYIFSFSNLNGQWGNAELDTLTNDVQRDLLNHKQAIAIDDFDNLHVVWSKSIDNGNQILYNRRTATGIWGNPVGINQGIGSGYNPTTALIPGQGQPAVAYILETEQNMEVAVSYFLQNVWNTVQITQTPESEFSPTIATDANGNIHLAWIGQNNTGDYKIYYGRLMLPDDVISIEELSGSQLGDFGTGADPYISLSETAGVLIGYRAGGFSNYFIQLAQKAPGSPDWNYEQISTPNADDYNANIQVKNNRIHLLVSGNDGFGIGGAGYYLTKEINGQWSNPEKVNNSINGVAWPSMVIDDNGAAHCLWEEIGGNILIGNIHYASNKSGNWQSQPLLMNGATHFANFVFNSKGQGTLIGELEDIQTFNSDLNEIVVFGVPDFVNTSSKISYNSSELSIFPNPTTSEVQLKQIGHQADTFRFEIFDQNGKLCIEKMVQGNEPIVLDRNQLPSGMYFYKIISSVSILKSGKIILK